MRYRFYRVHKYVCYELSEFDRLAAKTNFLDASACQFLKEKWHALIGLLTHHGAYEDEHIHELLRQKNSHIQLDIEKEHHKQEESFKNLKAQLESIMFLENKEEKILQGNTFYLSYRLFYSEMLKHLYDEEIIILPELQRLYSDKELAALQAKTYAKMAPEHMLGMLDVVFPHMNLEDITFFIHEMKTAEPQKFEIVWLQLPDAYKKIINSAVI